MMEAQYKTRGGQLTIKVQAENQKELFKLIAGVQNVFDENKCGFCGSTEIQFQVRTVESNDYYGLSCLKCRAQLNFGQHKTGSTLFVKRRDDNGPLPNNGWTKWEPKK